MLLTCCAAQLYTKAKQVDLRGESASSDVVSLLFQTGGGYVLGQHGLGKRMCLDGVLARVGCDDAVQSDAAGRLQSSSSVTLQVVTMIDSAAAGSDPDA